MSFERMFTRASIASLAAALALGAGAAAAQTVVKFGASTARETNHKWMDTFKERVEKRSNGHYRVDVYPGSQLGSIIRMVEGVQLGTIEFAMAIGEFLVGVDKRFGVVSAPGVFDDIAHGYRAVHDPEFVRDYWPLGEPKGVKLIAMYCPTETNFVSRAPIATLNDFKGKKVRVFPTAMERETLRVLGATAAPMPTDEVLPALQQGVIDGAKMAMTVFVAFKVQTVAKYAIRSNEALICPMAIVSKSWWDKQPEAMRKLMLEEAAAVDEEVQKYSVEFNENSYREWEKGGGLLQVPTPAERAAMMRQLAPVGETVAKGDPELEPVYAMLKRVAERTRQK